MEPILNTAIYTPLELFLFVGGCFLWVVIYAILIQRAHKINYIEMPILVAAGNIAWEFVWSFCFRPDMGLLIVWGYRLWFVLDIYIFYQAIKLGKNYIDIPFFKRHFALLGGILAIAWGVMFYFYIFAGYETKIGAMTAYIDNLVISALYVILILKPQTDVNLLSTPVAWLKMIGTGMNSVMMFLHFHSPEIYAGAYLLQILCTFVFVLDCLYIYWLVVRKRTGQPIL
jgi:hypothetical protein